MNNMITDDAVLQILDGMMKEINELSFKYPFDDEILWDIAKDVAEKKLSEAYEDTYQSKKDGF